MLSATTNKHVLPSFEPVNKVTELNSYDNNITDIDDPIELPWQQYASHLDLHSITNNLVLCTSMSDKNDYQAMLHELDLSHATIMASKFKTLNFMEANELVEKCNKMQIDLNTLYEHLRLQIDIQRAAAISFTITDNNNTRMSKDFAYSLFQSTQKTASLIDEFYFTSQRLRYQEASHLEHTAGVLAKYLYQQQPFNTTTTIEYNKHLKSILFKLENISQDLLENNIPIIKKLPSTSSLSTATTHSASSSDLSYQSGASTLVSMSIEEKINQVIDRLSQQYQKQKEELIRFHELQQSNHHESEDSQASKRYQATIEQQEAKIKELKNQLRCETGHRQSLQDQVSSLEHDLKAKDDELEKLKGKLNEPLLEDALAKQKEEYEQRIALSQNEINTANKELKDELNEMKTLWASVERIVLVGQDDHNRTVKSVLEDWQRKQLEDAKRIQTLEEKLKLLETKKGKEEEEVMTTKNSDNAELLLRKELEDVKKAFKEAQESYTTREAAMILQSASVEAELERILKEYDRLTRNITDFNLERKVFEDEIMKLQQEKEKIKKELYDAQVCQLSNNSDNNNNGNLRKEFRDLVANIKEKHEEEIKNEIERRRRLEQELRDVKADEEMKRWERVNTSVQTDFNAYQDMFP
ncbi:uncharacterized protein BX663DRAFT_503160 [Cokeromyces recurvatus]|uniref:uncharacterized protein n=1 Tax=Cokeromyces recurvatus TaxID=90255 RepID=UPI0022200D97|nr:uncharacterized protein BX663DRAFT_503160 [Cokeromyces recurvatus]KAI7904678.1 hypothetical protein BX663DRAFT_503160 [Cokeromyces recurvatus]